ncbi:MAG: OmpA family protein [Erythrobacter sp.]
MTNTTKRSVPLAAISMVAIALAVPAFGQDAQRTMQDEEPLTTIYGAPPSDLSGLEEGPDIEGLISAREGRKVQVTLPDGTLTAVTLSEGTEIKASGGFLGLAREQLNADRLLNGLPVEIETVAWNNRLIASEVKLKSSDLETAQMIRTGTSQQFAQQGAAIEENAAATEALRGRFGDIDQYNIKGTTNVYFDTGKWNLSGEARNELCSAATQAGAMDNALLLVVGYTDSTGSYEINQELSERRAGRVTNYLQQQCGWKPWRMLTPTGMAEADPVADNTTAYGKAQNRRVAVNVLVSKSVDGM